MASRVLATTFTTSIVPAAAATLAPMVGGVLIAKRGLAISAARSLQLTPRQNLGFHQEKQEVLSSKMAHAGLGTGEEHDWNPALATDSEAAIHSDKEPKVDLKALQEEGKRKAEMEKKREKGEDAVLMGSDGVMREGMMG